jgi:catechol 2,3-dioxygenase-like lactoylglutathione lyase family enzyme
MGAALAVVTLIASPPGAVPVRAQAAAEGKILRPNATVHIVADLDKSVAFYRDRVGLQPDNDVFLPPGPSAEGARLINSPGAEVRTATFMIPGTEVRLVLVQFTAGGSAPIHPRLQDYGQIKTVMRVRDIDVQFNRVREGLSGVFTSGGAPVRPEGPNGINRAVITRDPDGAPLEFVYQTVPPIPDSVPETSNVVGGWASFVVRDLPTTLAFYRSHLGFEVRGEGRQASAALLSLQGLPDATKTMSTGARIPGASFTWFLYAYDGVEKQAINGRLSQPGMTALSFYVENVPAMVQSIVAGGGSVETQGGAPVRIGGADRVFVRDPSGILIELRSAP